MPVEIHDGIPRSDAELLGVYQEAYPGTQIVPDIDYVYLELHYSLVDVIFELSQNCLHKGATRVSIHLHPGSLTIEDDFVHSPEEIGPLLDRLNTDKLERRKNIGETDKDGKVITGGIGIYVSRRTLKKDFNGGILIYVSTPDNRIVAQATWPVEEVVK